MTIQLLVSVTLKNELVIRYHTSSSAADEHDFISLPLEIARLMSV